MSLLSARSIQSARFLRASARLHVRHQSTSNSTHTFPSRWASHLLAGVAGGGVVVLGGISFRTCLVILSLHNSGYTWYHFSGLKRAVDATKSIQRYFQQTNKSLAVKHPNEALDYLRKAAKTYAAAYPGSGFFLDKAFDSLDEIFETHGEEASASVLKAYDDIRKIRSVQDLESLEMSVAIMEVLRRCLGELLLLSVKAGGAYLSPVLEKFPQVKVKMGDSVEELKNLAMRHGQRGQQIYADTQVQVCNARCNPSPMSLNTLKGQKHAFAKR